MSSTSSGTNAWSPAYDRVTETTAPDAVVPPWPIALAPGPLVLATDESELAGNAARVAVAVARRLGRGVRVVRVTETRGVALPPMLDAAVGMADALVGPDVHEGQCEAVRASIGAALGEPVDWPVHVGLGSPAPVIAADASEARAALVVLGLRRHGAVGRALGDETARHVARHAACPVLAVAPSLHDLPRCAVVALDFGVASREAARLAAALVAPGGTLTLAHAPYDPMAQEEGERWLHTLGLEAAFAALRQEFGAGDVVVETVLLEPLTRSPASDQLIALAERTGADLIALGSRRQSTFERWLLGSVTTEVLRDGRVSALVVPPPPPPPSR